MQNWQQLTFSIAKENLDQIESILSSFKTLSITSKSIDNFNIQIMALWDSKSDLENIMSILETSFDDILSSEIKYEIIQDKAWTSAWLNDFQPLEIGNNIIIYPAWQQVPRHLKHQTVIKVDPSEAFGSGDHPTTEMCLEWLEQNIILNSTVLDYGCGTGILAIVGNKLGAKYSLGIDNDAQAIKSSFENAKKNNLNANINFVLSEEYIEQKFDLLVANIFSNTLIELAPLMLKSLKQGGKIALSGILKHQTQDVKKAFKNKISFAKDIQTGEWFLLSGVKNGF